MSQHNEVPGTPAAYTAGSPARKHDSVRSPARKTAGPILRPAVQQFCSPVERYLHVQMPDPGSTYGRICRTVRGSSTLQHLDRVDCRAHSPAGRQAVQHSPCFITQPVLSSVTFTTKCRRNELEIRFKCGDIASECLASQGVASRAAAGSLCKTESLNTEEAIRELRSSGSYQR